MSLGGVIGGGFNAFAAPLLFDTVFEYPLVLMSACLARPWGRFRFSTREQVLMLVGLTAAGAALVLAGSQGVGIPTKLILAGAVVSAFLLRDRAWIFLGLSLALALAPHSSSSPRPDIIRTERGFFGVLRVTQLNTPELGLSLLLAHGTTLHGAQAEGAGAEGAQPWSTTPRRRRSAAGVPRHPGAQTPRSRSAPSAWAPGRSPSTRGRRTPCAIFEIDSPGGAYGDMDPRQLSYIKGLRQGAPSTGCSATPDSR